MRRGAAVLIATLLVGASVLLALLAAPPAQAIPAYSRLNGQSCGACHTAIPKLNQAGEEFRLSGYTRYEGGAVTPKVPPLNVGKLSLPGIFPISVIGTVGFDAVQIEERFRETLRTTVDTPNSINLEEFSLLASAPLNRHVSFIVEVPIAETEFERGGKKFVLNGPQAPGMAAISLNNLFIDDLLNLRLGAYELPVGPLESPEHRRLSIAAYQIYDTTAQQLLQLEGGSRTGIADEEQIFALGKPQLLVELYGTAYSERLGISNMYIRYHFGTSNDSNVSGDNNGSKSMFGRLSLTFMDQTVGFFGLYSPNVLDRARQDGFPGLRSSVLRFGPDVYLRFLDERLTVALQHLWARDSDPTGVGKAFKYQGGYAEVNYVIPTRIGSWVPLARYDYILANRFDNSALAAANSLAPSPVVTKPRVFAYTVGLQYLPWENVKFSSEVTYREQSEQLSKTVSTVEKDRIRELFFGLQMKVAF